MSRSALLALSIACVQCGLHYEGEVSAVSSLPDACNAMLLPVQVHTTSGTIALGSRAYWGRRMQEGFDDDYTDPTPLPSVVPGTRGPFLSAPTHCEWVIDGGGGQVVTATWVWSHMGVGPPPDGGGDSPIIPCDEDINTLTLYDGKRGGEGATQSVCWYDPDMQAGRGAGAVFTTTSSVLRIVLDVSVGGCASGFQLSFTVSSGGGREDRNCTLSAWSAWGACSAACGGGLTTRIRTVLSPSSGAGTCAGPLEESVACGQATCAPGGGGDRDCVVGVWGGWSPCASLAGKCGPGCGVQERVRSIVTPSSGSGLPCPTPAYLVESRACDLSCVIQACNGTLHGGLPLPLPGPDTPTLFGIGLPGLPARSLGNGHCQWTLDPGTWYSGGVTGGVTLMLSGVNIPTSEGCVAGYLRITNLAGGDALLPDICGSELPPSLALAGGRVHSRAGDGISVRLVTPDGDPEVGFAASYSSAPVPSPSPLPSSSSLPSLTPLPRPARPAHTAATLTLRGGNGAGAAWARLSREELEGGLRADLCAATGAPAYRFTGFILDSGAGGGAASLTLQVLPAQGPVGGHRLLGPVSHSASAHASVTTAHATTSATHTHTGTTSATHTAALPSSAPSGGGTRSPSPTGSPTPYPSPFAPFSHEPPVSSILAALASQCGQGRWQGSPLGRGGVTRLLDGGALGEVVWSTPAAASFNPPALALDIPFSRPGGGGKGVYTVTVKIVNTGGATLVVSGAGLTPAPGGGSPYGTSLLSLWQPPAFPVYLPGSASPPHSELSLTLTIDPTAIPSGATAASFAVLNVHHSDPSGPSSLPVMVQVSGAPPSPPPSTSPSPPGQSGASYQSGAMAGTGGLLGLATLLGCAYACCARRSPKDGTSIAWRLLKAVRGAGEGKRTSVPVTSASTSGGGAPKGVADKSDIVEVGLSMEGIGVGVGDEDEDESDTARLRPGKGKGGTGGGGESSDPRTPVSHVTTIRSGGAASIEGVALFGGLSVQAPPASYSPGGGVTLRPRPALKTADFESSWSRLSTYEVWGCTLTCVPTEGQLERDLAGRGVACMASGAVGGVTKYYFYGQEEGGGEGGAVLTAIAEVSVTLSTRRLTAVIKAPGEVGRGQGLGAAFTKAFKEGLAHLTSQ